MARHSDCRPLVWRARAPPPCVCRASARTSTGISLLGSWGVDSARQRPPAWLACPLAAALCPPSPLRCACCPMQLFNLTADPYEMTDLSSLPQCVPPGSARRPGLTGALLFASRRDPRRGPSAGRCPLRATVRAVRAVGAVPVWGLADAPWAPPPLPRVPPPPRAPSPACPRVGVGHGAGTLRRWRPCVLGWWRSSSRRGAGPTGCPRRASC